MKLINKVELIFLFYASLIFCCEGFSSVIETAINIADSTFVRNQANSIVWCNNIDEIDSFLSKFHGTVVLTPIQNDSTEIRKFNKKVGYQQTIFFARTVEEFADFMVVLNPETVVPIRLILVVIKPITDAEISAFTKTAWENDLADIIIVSTKEGTNFELTTFNPYSKGICGNHAPVTISLDEKKWFTKKFFNFQGCPIRVTILSLIPYAKINTENNTFKSMSGLQGKIFALVIEKLNASMDIVAWKEHGEVGTYMNGTATGSFADLVYRRADILAPAIVINYLRYPVAQISYVFDTIDICWFAPNRREIHDWMKVLQPLMTEISLAILTSYALFIVVTKIVMRFGRPLVYFRHSVAFQAFTLFLGQEVKFESKSRLVNYLFIVWIWYCMIVRIVYQGDLVNGLQKTILEKPLRNLKEAVRVLDGYGGSEAFREFYRGTSYFDQYKVLNLNDVNPLVRKVSDGMRFLIAADRMQALHLSNGIQTVGEPLSHAPVGFVMRPGWPASKEIDDVVRKLAEAGFIRKILKESLHEWMKKEQRHEDRKTQPLNMKTLIGCFYGLGFLYLICFCIFIGELVYYKLTLTRNL